MSGGGVCFHRTPTIPSFGPSLSAESHLTRAPLGRLSAASGGPRGTNSPSYPVMATLCGRNTGYPASLELRKIYEALPDADAEAHGLLRVIDESGEDYLYPRTLFVALKLPQEVATAVRRATG